MTMEDIRIAAAIFSSPTQNTDANLCRMRPMIRQAAKKNAGIICFPEMNITGYSSGADIESVAEPIPGRISQKLIDIAGEEGIAILAGMAEHDQSSRLYATHLVALPDGSLGVYRKIHRAPPEKAAYSQGEDLPLFQHQGVRFGIQLCYDAHFPELSTLMAQNGADVIFMPHASPRGTPEDKFHSWSRHLPARAFDNSLFIVACNQNGRNNNGLEFPGIAMAIDPSGQIIARDISGEDGLLIVDLSKAALAHVRNHEMRFFFPNRRPRFYDRVRAPRM